MCSQSLMGSPQVYGGEKWHTTKTNKQQQQQQQKRLVDLDLDESVKEVQRQMQWPAKPAENSAVRLQSWGCVPHKHCCAAMATGKQKVFKMREKLLFEEMKRESGESSHRLLALAMPHWAKQGLKLQRGLKLASRNVWQCDLLVSQRNHSDVNCNLQTLEIIYEIQQQKKKNSTGMSRSEIWGDQANEPRQEGKGWGSRASGHPRWRRWFGPARLRQAAVACLASELRHQQSPSAHFRLLSENSPVSQTLISSVTRGWGEAKLKGVSQKREPSGRNRKSLTSRKL